MAAWVLKTEPSEYSWDDLVKAGKAVWDGVDNPLARKHMRAAKPGDVAILYHTGKERRAIGIAKVTSAPTGDPVVFELEPIKPIAAPVGLDAIKKSKAFADSPLVKMGRLSVVPLTDAQLRAILALGKTSL